ncbi:hypothetical protein CH330_01480 [candidate division WOR-3 bacterium JGI_Cruoil_03_51_56]|uniref:Uncharacterized protein n=1 Tax=candidate division WOR-3 bacterium JGI_Cruoil_03_51_56 TaxID=1973747 RepID=A0A235BX84_UNCW3|nr:MAG: hypothetical protein CH330_01480 [candidate division WOR-3 bacterium JGI_Cruoil_03_51_56]
MRIYKGDIDKLKLASASSGKEEKEILHELLNKVPLDVFEELKQIASARAPAKRRKLTEAVLPETRPPGGTNIGDRLKSVIADAVETKVYLKTLGISLGDEPKQQSPYPPYWGQPPQQYPYPQPKEKRDIMETVAELKALDSLEKKETDPAILAILKELKDAQVKRLQTPAKQPKSGIRERLDELKEYAMTMRIFGTPDEAKKAEDLWREEMKDMRKELHQAQMDSMQRESNWKHQDLTRQITEIRNAPTEFDQITRMSQLSEKDPAIRAFMHKRLGIKDKGEPLTPEKLGKYIENVQVPVGKIAKMIWGYVEQHKGAAKPPPPTTIPPGAEIHEVTPEELATLPEQHLPPEITSTQPTQPLQVVPQPTKQTPAEPGTMPSDKHLIGETPTLEQRKETARQMLLGGTPVNLITKATKLSGQQIRGMKGSLVKQGKIKPKKQKIPKPTKKEEK